MNCSDEPAHFKILGFMLLPKAIVFDLGKVLVDFDYTIAARRLANGSAVSASPGSSRDAVPSSPRARLAGSAVTTSPGNWSALFPSARSRVRVPVPGTTRECRSGAKPIRITEPWMRALPRERPPNARPTVSLLRERWRRLGLLRFDEVPRVVEVAR